MQQFGELTLREIDKVLITPMEDHDYMEVQCQIMTSSRAVYHVYFRGSQFFLQDTLWSREKARSYDYYRFTAYTGAPAVSSSGTCKNDQFNHIVMGTFWGDNPLKLPLLEADFMECMAYCLGTLNIPLNAKHFNLPAAFDRLKAGI